MNHEDHQEETLHVGSGDFRMTKQRRVVYDVLLDQRDHPTAQEVYSRAKRRMPGISLATVYNCLDTMAQAGVVKQVNVARDATRFCPNLRPHAHFLCARCGEVLDVDLKPTADATLAWAMPEGASVEHLEVAMRGLCPTCASQPAQLV